MAAYTCCGTAFDTEEAYLVHRVKVHGEDLEPGYTCCGTPFYTEDGYREHRRSVHGETVMA